MLRLIVLLLLTVNVLSGCSTTEVVAEQPQYCYTSETIDIKDGSRVNSRTRVECSDDQVKRLVKHRMGIASNCGTFSYWTRKGGYNVQRQGISCQKPDGSWEIVNTTGY